MDNPLLKYSAKEYFFKAALCHFIVDELNAKVSGLRVVAPTSSSHADQPLPAGRCFCRHRALVAVMGACSWCCYLLMAASPRDSSVSRMKGELQHIQSDAQGKSGHVLLQCPMQSFLLPALPVLWLCLLGSCRVIS